MPEHWNVEELEKKSFSELSGSERRILAIRKKELKVQEAFLNFVSDEPTLADNALILYQYMKKMTIPKYAKLKLTREQLALCDDRVQAILGSLYSEVISVLHQNCVDNMDGVVSEFKKVVDFKIK